MPYLIKHTDNTRQYPEVLLYAYGPNHDAGRFLANNLFPSTSWLDFRSQSAKSAPKHQTRSGGATNYGFDLQRVGWVRVRGSGWVSYHVIDRISIGWQPSIGSDMAWIRISSARL